MKCGCSSYGFCGVGVSVLVGVGGVSGIGRVIGVVVVVLLLWYWWDQLGYWWF